MLKKQLFSISVLITLVTNITSALSHSEWQAFLIKKYRAQPASAQIEQSVRNALQSTGYDEPVIILECENYNNACACQNEDQGTIANMIIIDKNIKIFPMQFIIYHEIGHLYYRDSVNLNYITELSQASLAAIIIYLTGCALFYKQLTSPNLKTQLKAKVPISYVASLTCVYGTLYGIATKMQPKEARADHFAFNHLIQQQDFKTVFETIYKFLAIYDQSLIDKYFNDFFDAHPNSLFRAQIGIMVLHEYNYSLKNMPTDLDETIQSELVRLLQKYNLTI